MDYFFQYQSAKCHYRIEGEGLAVLLIHGFAEDHTVWNNQVEFLKKYCKVITPDLPGSGSSDVIAYPLPTVSVSDYAGFIKALLQHAGVETSIMLGHSMGGYIVLAFAENYPQMLSGFGFVHSTAFVDSEEKKAVRKKAIGTIQQYGSAAFIRSTTPNTFGAAYKAEHPEAIEVLIERGKSFTTAALQQYYTAMMNRPDRSHVLITSKVPVLFIIGLEDTAVPPADALKQVHLPDEAQVYTLAQVGHMGMWEAADEVNTALLAFISYVEQAAKNIN